MIQQSFSSTPILYGMFAGIIPNSMLNGSQKLKGTMKEFVTK
ncbi:MAG: hypothetical protein QXY52_00155 [Conexivisphaerales archaeon]